MIKWIIFDFDGVLGDSFPVAEEIFYEVKAHNDLKSFNFRDVKDMGIKAALKKAEIRGFKLLKALSLFKKVKQDYSEQLANVPLFPNVKKVILELSKRYNLGILSSNHKKNIEVFLEKESMTDLFQFVSHENSIFGKDKALRKMMRRHHIKKGTLIYVGDEDRDIEAMRKINVPIITVSWGYNSERHLLKYNPHYLAKTPNSILKHVDKIDVEKELVSDIVNKKDIYMIKQDKVDKVEEQQIKEEKKKAIKEPVKIKKPKRRKVVKEVSDSKPRKSVNRTVSKPTKKSGKKNGRR
jgi:phosphoglycolate phosphatase